MTGSLRTAVLLAALALDASARAQGVELDVSPTDSSFSYSVKKWGVFEETGRFRKFRGSLHLDEARPEASRVRIVVEVESVDSGAEGRDSALRSADFFDARRYPTMTFVSTEVRRGPDGKVVVTGDLTIRGVTKRVSFPVTFHGAHRHPSQGTLAGFETTFTVDRRDFAVGTGSWANENLLAPDVRLKIVLGAREK